MQRLENSFCKPAERRLVLIAHAGAHNAYHIGQILYVRRLQGSWDPAKGVK
jgi:hypothetical protein